MMELFPFFSTALNKVAERNQGGWREARIKGKAKTKIFSIAKRPHLFHQFFFDCHARIQIFLATPSLPSFPAMDDDDGMKRGRTRRRGVTQSFIRSLIVDNVDVGDVLVCRCPSPVLKTNKYNEKRGIEKVVNDVKAPPPKYSGNQKR